MNRCGYSECSDPDFATGKNLVTGAHLDQVVHIWTNSPDACCHWHWTGDLLPGHEAASRRALIDAADDLPIEWLTRHVTEDEIADWLRARAAEVGS